MKRSKITCFTIAAIMFTSLGCNTESSEREEDKNNINSKTRNMEMTFLDEYTVARSDEAVVKHLELDIKVNFERKIISGKATYQIENKKGVDMIYFDTRNMNIEKVTLGEDEEDTKFALGYYVEVLGNH